MNIAHVNIAYSHPIIDMAIIYRRATIDTSAAAPLDPATQSRGCSLCSTARPCPTLTLLLPLQHCSTLPHAHAAVASAALLDPAPRSRCCCLCSTARPCSTITLLLPLQHCSTLPHDHTSVASDNNAGSHRYYLSMLLHIKGRSLWQSRYKLAKV